MRLFGQRFEFVEAVGEFLEGDLEGLGGGHVDARTLEKGDGIVAATAGEVVEIG